MHLNLPFVSTVHRFKLMSSCIFKTIYMYAGRLQDFPLKFF